MTRKIKIHGKASKKDLEITVFNNDERKNLLFFLKEEKGQPIASSCNGEKVCKKCIFNKDKLMCSFTVEEIDEVINIDYM